MIAYLEKLSCAGRDRFRRLGPDRGNQVHMYEAVRWLWRAQDATSDSGVSHSYKIGAGWQPSYPETTGYIIPTLLNWANISSDEDSRARAISMADWETAIQYASGAVTGGVSGSGVGPVVFNTGQVIFGWVSAYRATGRLEFLESAVKAAEWLLANLDGDGIWSSHGNMGARKRHTYNVRVAWAILELWKVKREPKYIQAIEPFIRWVRSQERAAGWFDNNCLTDDSCPLLHTIAYTAQGLLESGMILEDGRLLNAAKRTADALLSRVETDGRMAGRFDREWRPQARWCCLTGMAQMGIVWQRLHATTGEQKYRDAASRVSCFLRRTQDIESRNPGIRGGVKGSYPVDGGYGAYRVLNWATKFFLDLLILEESPGFARSDSYMDG